MCVQRSTALGPRIPKPMKPTRTVSSLGVISSITSCCPAGRSGTGTSRGAYSFVAVVSLGIGVQPARHNNAIPTKKVDRFLIMALLIEIYRLIVDGCKNRKYRWKNLIKSADCSN